MASTRKLLTALLLLQYAASAVLAGQGYVVTGPKILTTDSVETFCVSIEGPHWEGDCSLELMAVDDDVVYSSLNHRIQGPKDCVKLSVPPIADHYRARLRWRMQFDELPGHKVDTIKEVGLRRAEPIHLIQTDKAWYTPGQLVRVRILSLDHVLHPMLHPLARVWIEDPTGTAVTQWLNSTGHHGIHQLEFQLSVEPVQGLWRIRMERDSLTKSDKEFEVREYVLPKFEVNINPPPYISFNEDGDLTVQKVVIGICAKYSHGQPLRGDWKATVRVTDNGRYYRWRHKPPVIPVAMDMNGTLNGETGCHSIKLSGDQLAITTYDGTIDKTVQVVAVVTEQGTGIEMNSTWSTTVKRQSLTMDIASWSSGTFKNGLPYYGKIKVTRANGEAAAGTAVEVCAQPNYKEPAIHQERNATATHRPGRHRHRRPVDSLGLRRVPRENKGPRFCAIRVADGGGIVAFELLPSEPEIFEYEIKATVSRVGRVRRSILAHLVAAAPFPGNNIAVETSFIIRSLHSPSESFLAFVPPPTYPNAIGCSSKLPVKLYFTADKEINFNLHYIVMARGDIVLTGVKQVKFIEEDNIDLSLGETLLNKRSSADDGQDGDSETESSLKLVGDVEFEIDVPAEYSPKISLLAYYVRDDNEVVTASIEIPVENCFPNPVKLSWSSRRKQPGQNVTMSLSSGPGSVCGYSVVDRSVTFVRPDLQLGESDIYRVLPRYHIEAGSQPLQVTPDWEYCANKSKPEQQGTKEFNEWDDLRRRRRSFIHTWRYSTSGKDAMEAFDKAGLLVMSDLNIETRPCVERQWQPRAYPMSRMQGPLRAKFRMIPDEPFDNDGPMMFARIASMPVDDGPQLLMASPRSYSSPETSIGDSYESVVDLSSEVSVRTYFPETWLWDLITLDGRGELRRSFEMPHTVTTWVGRAMCVSEALGFGMSPSADVEAFQPFFVELHLPYAVKRAEKLPLKVSVFNYAPHTLPVRLTLAYSEQFELINDSDSASMCIQPRNSAVHHFLVQAIELGAHNVTVSAVVDDNYPGECGPEVLPSGQDSVVKALLVQPEGFPVERVNSHMACPKDFDEDKTLSWDLSLPDDLVEGSARAWITAVGDLMGPALQGLTGLVRLPTGCGEQNMILFTPNIYVIQYLEATNQLEASFKGKAVNYMKSGYQRELTYRHDDGSYSAFGKNDPSGSLWLTAFVVKSFAAARRFIHVDENELQTSVRWLQSKQMENGCFPVVGTVLHKDLKGGLSDNEEDLTPLTAFTFISLLETYAPDGRNNNETAALLTKLTENTLLCLAPDEQRDVYTRALTAYALVLAGRVGQARKSLDWLMSQAQHNNSLTWWQKSESGLALNVEMTSYVLLTLVKLGEAQDLVTARSIVRWLSKQRNSEGGFVSTQDTVVALQAIAAYASLIGVAPIDMEMLVTAGGLERSIRIREHNRLIQRRIDLPSPLASEVSVVSVGEGNGCAIVQSTLRYNVHTPPPSAAFDLNVTVTEESRCGPKRIVFCARYTLPGASNMALVEISLVSGYDVNRDALLALTRHEATGVKRTEVKGDVVVLYFDQIASAQASCVEVIVQAAFQVNDAKDANVKIYDYYEPEHSRSVAYHLPTGCDLAPIAAEAIGDIASPPTPKRAQQPNKTESTEDEVIVEPIATKIDASSLMTRLAQAAQQQHQRDEMAANGKNRVGRRHSNKKLPSDHLGMKEADDDLQVPDGLESPLTTYVLPGHVRGCPRCLAEAPENLAATYCQSESAFWAETRPQHGHRLRLTQDYSVRLPSSAKLNASSLDILMEPQCRCSLFDKDRGNRVVTVLGLPSAPHPLPPLKLMVGPELLIIGQSAKQLNLKSIRFKCQRYRAEP